MERVLFLKANRIGFSKWLLNDIALAQLLWGDPQVTQYICASGKFTAKDIDDRLNTEIFNESKYHVQYWPFFDLATDDFIGCCGLRPHGIQEYEMGFHLRPCFWGYGYGQEAAIAVINYAFSTLHARKLFAGHNPNNIRSQRLLKKLGFAYIGDVFYAPTGVNHPSYELENPNRFSR